MQYQEFLELAKITDQEVGRAEYDKEIEIVYMWHPRVKDKKHLVQLYQQGLIPDLLPKAQRVSDLNQSLRDASRAADENEKRRQADLVELKERHRAAQVAEQEAMIRIKAELTMLEEQ